MPNRPHHINKEGSIVLRLTPARDKFSLAEVSPGMRLFLRRQSFKANAMGSIINIRGIWTGDERQGDLLFTVPIVIRQTLGKTGLLYPRHYSPRCWGLPHTPGGNPGTWRVGLWAACSGTWLASPPCPRLGQGRNRGRSKEGTEG